MSRPTLLDRGLYIHLHTPNGTAANSTTPASSTSDSGISNSSSPGSSVSYFSKPGSTAPTSLASGLPTPEEFGHTNSACNELQWAIYFHHNDSEGGTLYQVEATEGGLIAKHDDIRDVLRCECILRYIADVPASKLRKVDDTARALDNALRYFKECTSMKWVLMIVALFMEDDVVKDKNLRSLKQNMEDWADMAHHPILVDDEDDSEGD